MEGSPSPEIRATPSSPSTSVTQSPPSPGSGILEAIMAQKMATAKFLRSNSLQSVDSVCSSHSNFDPDQCRCDDCILGITDLLAEFTDLRMARMSMTSVSSAVTAAVSANSLEIPNSASTGSGLNGLARRKVRYS